MWMIFSGENIRWVCSRINASTPGANIQGLNEASIQGPKDLNGGQLCRAYADRYCHILSRLICGVCIKAHRICRVNADHDFEVPVRKFKVPFSWAPVQTQCHPKVRISQSHMSKKRIECYGIRQCPDIVNRHREVNPRLVPTLPLLSGGKSLIHVSISSKLAFSSKSTDLMRQVSEFWLWIYSFCA